MAWGELPFTFASLAEAERLQDPRVGDGPAALADLIYEEMATPSVGDFPPPPL